MRIATFNINGIKARLPRLLEWLDETRPDIACLQEIKTSDETFPEKVKTNKDDKPLMDIKIISIVPVHDSS